MAKIRLGKLSRLEFLAQLRQLLARHRYTMVPMFNRIAIYDADGRTVCSFRQMEGDGPVDLRFGGE
jgi:hypothetical protein